ncbi:MAG: hypothetical protein ACI841_001373 [Planctomycetota bacterium]|jgi:hypothetical protein
MESHRPSQPFLPRQEGSPHSLNSAPDRRSIGEQILGSPSHDQRDIAVVPIPRTLTNSRYLIGGVLDSLKRAKPNEDGLLVPVGQDVLRLILSPASHNRALRIMQALILSVEAAFGYKLKIDKSSFLKSREEDTLRPASTLKTCAE